MRKRTTPEVVMLRCYGWWWHDGVNMIGIGYGFIKPSLITISLGILR